MIALAAELPAAALVAMLMYTPATGEAYEVATLPRPRTASVTASSFTKT